MDVDDMEAIARRVLTFRHAGVARAVPVTVFRPLASGADWRCAYEIGWPSQMRRSEAYGVDSVQALLLAMQKIGAELYAARPKGVQDLQWLAKDEGFGFPMPPSLRDLAVGEDRLI